MLSCSVMSDSLWPHELQHTKVPCPSLSPSVCSTSCPMSRCRHPTISSSVASFSPYPQFFPASGSFSISQLFISCGQSIGASASASVLPMNNRVDFLEDGLLWSPCSPRDSQESTPTPRFKSMNSSVLSLLYGPTLTFIQNHWKNYTFDNTYLCQKSDISCF